MSNDLNTVVIVGRIVRDPENKQLPSGQFVSNFSIANNKTWMKEGEKKEQASFFNCVAWGPLSEVISKHCYKGQLIGINGRLQQRSWDDGNGNKRSAVEILVNNLQFLSAKKKDEQPKQDGNQQNINYENTMPMPNGYIPF